ncbi:TatD-related deoxyribonuclease [Methanocalculus alkaliphilus]|uniref:TatD family hydrolase n=1 Tax=Methanocalculus alkaliphilus TaxID=768730 RepID=UPI00209CAB13|nr:TatD family hydrolase [Methanocalculus alkaliphilus]MCP1714632.1 TatD-related deoxyribonuclease [Methanocalculus alkaliphilus]
MQKPRFPITDDHMHIDPVNGIGINAVKEFARSGGTHIFLVTKPSWSFGIDAVRPDDFRPVFEKTIALAVECREAGVTAFPILGVHPAEISRLTARMSLADAEALMIGALRVAAEYAMNGEAVALKSGRPHYEVDAEVWAASNRVLASALQFSAECGCAVQLHAESGPCADVVGMAEGIGMPVDRVVKHFATPDTPLHPSFIANHESIPEAAEEGKVFTMESDYIDERDRPGSVLGPRSVPRFTLRHLEAGRLSEEAVWRIHAEVPERVYGVEITL